MLKIAMRYRPRQCANNEYIVGICDRAHWHDTDMLFADYVLGSGIDEVCEKCSPFPNTSPSVTNATGSHGQCWFHGGWLILVIRNSDQRIVAVVP